MSIKKCIFIVTLAALYLKSYGQGFDLSTYNVVWNSQSKNSSESMPCGGGDVGLNVWVENNDIFFYVARSGTFDENNALLKLGRVRIQLSPNPFPNGMFRQELKLQEGCVLIQAANQELKAEVKIWADVFHPAVHVEIQGSKAIRTKATYESWRFADRIPKGKENNANSYKWAPQGEVVTRKDSVAFGPKGVLFYHQNRKQTVFDVAVQQQGLEEVKDQLWNPIGGLQFGGLLSGDQMEAAGTEEGTYQGLPFRGWALLSKKAVKRQRVDLFFHTSQHSKSGAWEKELDALSRAVSAQKDLGLTKTKQWWKDFWNRSYILVKPGAAQEADADWQMGRNYQLFRYLLACNAHGTYPTKFNGGLFTVDPVFTDSSLHYTPDFRNWGGGTHTAQNQRLVYWPMLKTGDVELMKPAFDFYLRILRNAELRTHVYWNHAGASFTEQIENFGLPNPAEYEWKRPADFDKGVEYNAWLEYEWDTALEFCNMILESRKYGTLDIQSYLPLIRSCLRFFDEHYQYLASKRGRKSLDGEGHLILYPGSAGETYKMAYNANSTIAALRRVTEGLLELPTSLMGAEEKEAWQGFLSRIPPLNFRTSEGKTLLSPAKLWERVNNTESMQLYPVFPWRFYGVGQPGLDTAINTYRYDPDALKFRSHVGWKQDNIFAACLGLKEEALHLNRLKLANSGRRFPAFWGPGFDWVPDHNWGGSGMIGLQEMLLQAVDDQIYLFPAWSLSSDVSFKLVAPQQTVIEAELTKGKLSKLNVYPESRRKDIILPKNLYDNIRD